MRLTRDVHGDRSREIEAFSKWILDIENGKINEPNSGEVEIDIPEDLLITQCENPMEEIVKGVYGISFPNERNPKFYQGRVIMSPRNMEVDTINDYMLPQLTSNFNIIFQKVNVLLLK